jgi:hypothetical protein
LLLLATHNNISVKCTWDNTGMELAVITEILCHPMKDIEKVVINGEYDVRRKEVGEVF